MSFKKKERLEKEGEGKERGRERSWKMIEQAKEELEMLETHHPNRFGYLKMELKSFIFLLESQHINGLMYYESPVSLPTCSTAATQASTSRKRKKGGSESETYEMICRNGASKHKLLRFEAGNLKRRDRIDLVLEKAQSCLKKIQQLKSSLC